MLTDLEFLRARIETPGAEAQGPAIFPLLRAFQEALAALPASQTGRNDVARGFYAHRGFSEAGEGLFALALGDQRLLPPPGIDVEAAHA